MHSQKKNKRTQPKRTQRKLIQRGGVISLPKEIISTEQTPTGTLYHTKDGIYFLHKNQQNGPLLKVESLPERSSQHHPRTHKP
jgi:hypothetical protein